MERIQRFCALALVRLKSGGGGGDGVAGISSDAYEECRPTFDGRAHSAHEDSRTDLQTRPSCGAPELSGNEQYLECVLEAESST